MPDDIDRSCEEQDFHLNLALMRQKALADATRRLMPPVGLCYNCREPVTGDRLYCDKECEADDLSRRRRQQGRQA